MITGIVLQARIDSKRLPGKALEDLCGEPMIYRVMEALNRVSAGIRVLACPENCLAQFRPLAERAGFEIFGGPEDDVLGRYCGAARRFRIGRVIRATGDNPFVFADAAVALSAEAGELDADYAGYAGLPFGAGVESVKSGALFRAEKEAAGGPEREHVCPYLYGRPELFALHRPLAPPAWRGPDMRVTVDTGEDFERAELLYRALARGPGDRYSGGAIIRAYRQVIKQ
ncbi:MAG: spore coat protein [Spirochaetaceae bacterium]|jgi:spore coat polysaccharide biosynthesis protein SpsF|nr:spore coat protein [Spirochaetaceae bacterium]